MMAFEQAESVDWQIRFSKLAAQVLSELECSEVLKDLNPIFLAIGEVNRDITIELVREATENPAFRDQILTLSSDIFVRFLQRARQVFGGDKVSDLENELTQVFTLIVKDTRAVIQDAPGISIGMKKNIGHYLDLIQAGSSVLGFQRAFESILDEGKKTAGHSFCEGLENFLHDLKLFKDGKLAGRLAVCRQSGLSGLAPSKGSVVFENHLIQLIQYQPLKPVQFASPVLIVPAWINKYYILDLNSEMSLIKWLLERGIQVFAISWVNPDQRHGQAGFSEYLEHGLSRAVQIIKERYKIEKLDLFGYCLGGTLLSAYLMKSRAEDHVKSATFLATLIDFSDPGALNYFVNPTIVAALDQYMQDRAYLHSSWISYSFDKLRPGMSAWIALLKRYGSGKNTQGNDFDRWCADGIHVSKTMIKDCLHHLYLKNDMIHDLSWPDKSAPRNLSFPDIPIFAVTACHDHLVPWEKSLKAIATLSANSQLIVAKGGHVSAIINPPSQQKGSYKMPNAQSIGRGERELVNLEEFQGSWWDAWLTWYKKNHIQSSLEFTVEPEWIIEPAPGSYAKNV